MYSVSGTSFHKRSNIFVNPCTHSLRRSINVEIAIRNVRKLRPVGAFWNARRGHLIFIDLCQSSWIVKLNVNESTRRYIDWKSWKQRGVKSALVTSIVQKRGKRRRQTRHHLSTAADTSSVRSECNEFLSNMQKRRTIRTEIYGRFYATSRRFVSRRCGLHSVFNGEHDASLL